MEGTTFGNYRVVRQIGEGGMGAVYEAEHVLLGRRAAVKVLLPEHSANQQTVTRFFNEARAATSIKHRGIVEIYDFGHTGDGTAFIAMEMLDGESLSTRMHRGQVPLPSALAIVRQIAGALAAAHQAGIVHRDLKPDNVFIVPDSEVAGGERIKLLDFGIAKLVSAAGRNKTSTGAVLGTPTYMAPEQCRGVTVDHRADLYALGCIVFEMLAGRPPFTGEGTGDILAAHIHVPPPKLRSFVPAVAPSVEDLVMRMLAKDPANRTGSANELIAQIDRLPRTALEASVRTAPRRPRTQSQIAAAVTTLGSSVSVSETGTRRRRVGYALAGASALALVAAVAFTSSRGREGAAGMHDAVSPDPGPARPAVEVAPAEPPPATEAVAAAALPPPVEPQVAEPGPPATSADERPPVPAPPARKMTTLVIDSEPPGAIVRLNGAEAGVTPFHKRVPAADSYSIVVQEDGYFEESFELKGSGKLSKRVALRPRLVEGRSRNPFKR